MGDSACLMQNYSSHVPETASRDKEGNSIFGGSVSFGRFVSETLAWEKWSSFSQNRYLEEVEKYSTPGTVAQKKAYFEAHYKRIAAKKAAALLEKSNSESNHVPAVKHEERVEESKSDPQNQLVESTIHLTVNKPCEVESLGPVVVVPASQNGFGLDEKVDDMEVQKVEDSDLLVGENNPTVSRVEESDMQMDDRNPTEILVEFEPLKQPGDGNNHNNITDMEYDRAYATEMSLVKETPKDNHEKSTLKDKRSNYSATKPFISARAPKILPSPLKPFTPAHPKQETSATPSSRKPIQESVATPKSRKPKQESCATPNSLKPKQTSGVTPNSRKPKHESSATSKRRPKQESGATPNSSKPKQESSITPSSWKPKQESCATPNSLKPKQASGVTPSSWKPKQESCATPNNLKPKQASGVTPNSRKPKHKSSATPKKRPKQESGATSNSLKPKQESSITPSSWKPKQESSATPSSRKLTTDSIETKRSTSKPRHMSINISHFHEHAISHSVFNKRASPILENLWGSKTAANAKTTSDTPNFGQRKAAISRSLNGALRLTSMTPPDIKRIKTPLGHTTLKNRILDEKWQSFSVDHSKSSSTSGRHAFSPTVSVGFSFRSEERAVKRKEFFQKLEEKFNAKEAQEVEGELKSLSQRLGFKAEPLPDFYHEKKLPRNQIKKVQVTKPKSPKLGRKHDLTVFHDASSSQPPPRPPVKTSASMNRKETQNFPSKKTHENTCPNIQSQ
ncbi:uncharacterized protein [Aristolochia californica]|uniref:uncharacterized protein n=1 Tax=Aristolochia californica TaxID=171875 RepID=UPI0035DEE93D